MRVCGLGILLLFIGAARAGAPAGYYNSTTGLTGGALRR